MNLQQQIITKINTEFPKFPHIINTLLTADQITTTELQFLTNLKTHLQTLKTIRNNQNITVITNYINKINTIINTQQLTQLYQILEETHQQHYKLNQKSLKHITNTLNKDLQQHNTLQTTDNEYRLYNNCYIIIQHLQNIIIHNDQTTLLQTSLTLYSQYQHIAENLENLEEHYYYKSEMYQTDAYHIHNSVMQQLATI